MLAIAIQHREALTRALSNTVDDPHFDNFYTEGYITFIPDLKNDNWQKHQFVSLNHISNVVGYFEANVCRRENYVDNLSIINFAYGWNPTFYKDLKRFIIRLFFRYNYCKLVWNVVVGSANEELYDKFATSYGARVVGIFKNHKMLQDGSKKDIKYYELTKEDFESHLKIHHPKQLEKLDI